jgi:DNA replication protein DnaD
LFQALFRFDSEKENFSLTVCQRQPIVSALAVKEKKIQRRFLLVNLFSSQLFTSINSFNFLFCTQEEKSEQSETEEETQDTTSFQEHYTTVKNSLLSGEVESSRSAIFTAFYNLPSPVLEGFFYLY